MTSEPGPLADQNVGNEALPPAKLQLWTPRFILICALLALLGIAAALFGAAGKPIGGGETYGSLLSAHQAAFILTVVLIGVCLSGLWLVSNKTLRAGLLLRTIVAASAFVNALALLGLVNNPFFQALVNFILASPVSLFLLNFLAVLSQLRFSYGLVRWQPSDKLSIWLQLLLTLGGGFVIVQGYSLPPISDSAFFLWTVTGPFFATAGVACLLLRPACWKASPLIVLCLTGGGTAALLFDHLRALLFNQADAALLGFAIATAIHLASDTLFILGLLLLIQRERRQKENSALPVVA